MRASTAFVLLAALAASCGGDSTGPLPGPGDTGPRLEIVPGALLLPGPGASGALAVDLVTSTGARQRVSATFSSSDPSAVTVSAAGIATAAAASGASVVTAHAQGLTSAPVLALIARPADGALLVADSQVVSTLDPVDPGATYGPGWQYRVRLRGVSPDVGQVVLAGGGALVGGRVVSVVAEGGETVVVLALLPVAEMFPGLGLHVTMPLDRVPLTPSPAARSLRRDQPPMHLEASAAPSSEFDLGPFECKAEMPSALRFPVTLDVYSFEIDPTLDLDLAFADGDLTRLIVTGSIAPRLTANPTITAAIEGKVECKLQLATLHLPLGGPLALIVGGQVPLGVGFEIGAKTTVAQIGFDLFLQSAIEATFGIDCAGGCRVVTDLAVDAPDGYFKPRLPTLDDLRTELGVSAFGYAELAIGNAFLQALQFKAVELKAGLEQKAELATIHAQAADPAYASKLSLAPVLEAKAASSLTALGELLKIELATLTYAPQLPTISETPHGTFTITPAQVRAGDNTAVGERATFTVTLDPVTYLGTYDVEKVEIRWKKTATDGTVTLEPGRPGCTDLAAAQDQAVFTCTTDFTADQLGAQTFYAFVHARLWGVPVTVPLEIAPDAKATVVVGEESGVTVTPSSATVAPGAQAQFTATVTGLGSTGVSWTATGGTLSSTTGETVTYTAGSSPGSYSVTATATADPTQHVSAQITIVGASVPAGGRILNADGRLDPFAQALFTACNDHDLIAPTAVPANLSYTATATCPTITESDQSGHTGSGYGTTQQSYHVVTSNGTLTGDLSSITIDGQGSGTASGYSGMGEGSSRMALCFSVPQGVTYHYVLSGALSVSGAGYAQTSLIGPATFTFSAGEDVLTGQPLPPSVQLNATGALPGGNYCFDAREVASASVYQGAGIGSAEAHYSNVKLEIVP